MTCLNAHETDPEHASRWSFAEPGISATLLHRQHYQGAELCRQDAEFSARHLSISPPVGILQGILQRFPEPAGGSHDPAAQLDPATVLLLT